MPLPELKQIRYKEALAELYNKKLLAFEDLSDSMSGVDFTGHAGAQSLRTRLRVLRQEIKELTAALEYKFQQTSEVVAVCEDVLQHANGALESNQQALTEFLISPLNKQKTYQEMLQLFELQTGRHYFGKCRATLDGYLLKARNKRVKKVTKSLSQKLRDLHNLFYSREPANSINLGIATKTYRDSAGVTKWAVVDILHKLPLDEKQATTVVRDYLGSLRNLIEALSYDITYLKQYGSEQKSQDCDSDDLETVTHNEADQAESTNVKMKIFISHSHKNGGAAKALVDFLLSGLLLEDADVRCTSVPGHQLRFGKTIAELLKGDINLAPAVIALISKESQKADWVLFELGAAWGLGRDIFPVLGPGIEVRDLPGPLASLPCVVVEAEDAASRMIDLMQQIHEDLGVELKGGGKVQANLSVFLDFYRHNSPKGSRPHGDTISPANEEEAVLLAIWKLAESEYDQYGYSLEAIAQRAALSIPKCEHVLDGLIKKKFVEQKTYLGGITGNRYTLKDEGREQLLQRQVVK